MGGPVPLPREEDVRWVAIFLASEGPSGCPSMDVCCLGMAHIFGPSACRTVWEVALLRSELRPFLFRSGDEEVGPSGSTCASDPLAGVGVPITGTSWESAVCRKSSELDRLEFDPTCVAPEENTHGADARVEVPEAVCPCPCRVRPVVGGKGDPWDCSPRGDSSDTLVLGARC